MKTCFMCWFLYHMYFSMIDYMYKPSKKEKKKNLKGDMERTKLFVHGFTSCKHWSVVWWLFWLVLHSRLKQATHHESLIHGKDASVDCRLYSLRWMSRWNSINARVYTIVGSLFKWWFWGGGVLPKYTWLELFSRTSFQISFFFNTKTWPNSWPLKYDSDVWSPL